MNNPLCFKYHVFFCCNQRENEKACCANLNANGMHEYAKERIAARSIPANIDIRINSTGCLNRCNLGPVIVVYPEGVWYSYIDEVDVDEIIYEHLMHNRIVDRLLI